MLLLLSVTLNDILSHWRIIFVITPVFFLSKFSVEAKICDRVSFSAKPKTEFINWSSVSASPEPNFGRYFRFRLLFIFFPEKSVTALSVYRDHMGP